jgi:hypothetical protein
MGVNIYNGNPTQESLDAEKAERDAYITTVKKNAVDARAEQLNAEQTAAFNDAILKCVNLSTACGTGIAAHDFSRLLMELQFSVNKFQTLAPSSFARCLALQNVLRPYSTSQGTYFSMSGMRPGTIGYYAYSYSVQKNWRLGAATVEETRGLFIQASTTQK